MRKVILLMLSLMSTISYAQNMEFCVVDKTGSVIGTCWSNIDSCQNYVQNNKAFQYMCVARPKAN